MPEEITLEMKREMPNLPPGTKISDDSEVTLEQLRESMDAIKVSYKNVNVQWDDVIQATTFGAAILLRPEIVEESLADKYLSRETSPEEFFVTEYGFDKEELATFLKENYEQILKISPLMENIKNFFTWTAVWENVHIFFKHEFEYSFLMDDIRNTLDKKVNIFFHIGEMEPKTIGEKPDMIFGLSALPFYEYYTVEKKLAEVVYMTSLMNSGFSIEFIAAYMKTAEINPTKRPLGPYFSQIFFYTEQFHAG